MPDPKDPSLDYRAGYMAALRDLHASNELIELQARIFELEAEFWNLKDLRRVAVRIHGEPIDPLDIPSFLRLTPT